MTKKAKDINEVPGVVNTEISEPRQVNYKDFDGDESFLFEYDFLIEINNIKLNSKIRLIPLGDSGYNIVLSGRPSAVFSFLKIRYNCLHSW